MLASWLCCGSLSAQLWEYRYQHHLPNQPFQKDKGLVTPRGMEALLHRFAEKAYGKGFRYLGDENDFFHGHFLYTDELPPDSEGMMHPFAILYHTQEEASRFHVQQPGHKYDYLNVKTRNWVQFIEPLTEQSQGVANAFRYMFDRFPYSDESLAITHSHHTVFADQIDGRKFPSVSRHRIVGQRQIEFRQHACDEAPDSLASFMYSGDIQVTLADGIPLCLRLRVLSIYDAVSALPDDERQLANTAVPTLDAAEEGDQVAL